MTITASPCIKDSCLMVRGKVVFTQVPQNVVVSPASSDSSAFIGATSTTQSSRHVFSLGFLEKYKFYVCSDSKSAREDFTLHDEVSSDAAAENTFYILLLPVLEGVKDNSGLVCKGLPKMSSNPALRVEMLVSKLYKHMKQYSSIQGTIHLSFTRILSSMFIQDSSFLEPTQTLNHRGWSGCHAVGCWLFVKFSLLLSARELSCYCLAFVLACFRGSVFAPFWFVSVGAVLLLFLAFALCI
ncbi:hypothetical protein Q3G72_026184 [Acer saccharum]|nr:hypothetical protein Q3G72_026184 [Acer saccharum]